MTRSLLSRYILRAWLAYLLGALLLFGGLLLIHQTVGLTKGLLAERASFKWLPVFLFMAIPEVLSLVLPMAAIFGGILGTQQLAQGSELVAAQGLGTGTRVFFRPWAFLSAALILMASFNAHGLIPASHRSQATLRNRLAEEAKQRFLRPGSPPVPIPGDHPRALWTSLEGQVHILDVSPKGAQHLVSDRVAWTWEAQTPSRSTLHLRLEDVSGSFLPRGRGSAAQLRQTSQSISFPIQISTSRRDSDSFREASTRDLMERSDPRSRAELARRFSLPILAAAMLLMGIALGYGHPRFQKGSGVLGGLGVVMLYFIAHRTLDNKLDAGNNFMFFTLLLLPLLLMMIAFIFLQNRTRPHKVWAPSIQVWLSGVWKQWRPELPDLDTNLGAPHPSISRGILERWSRKLWFRSWAGILATLLVLHLLIEYSAMAGDLAANGKPIRLFFAYWFWRLPSFLTTALPVSFMLGTVFAISTATLSQEWVALRTGGVSLWQWIWRALGAWLPVLGATLLLQNAGVPAGAKRARELQLMIQDRAPRGSGEVGWQHLGATGVLWFMEPARRFGFPLKPPGEAPSILTLEPGSAFSEGLPWDGFALRQGPSTKDLFPDASLLGTPVPEENSTLDLIRWQKWAYEPSRATHLWSRLLAWLAGPCLVFAVLPRAFPNPRSGRGGTLALALVAGLLFLGLQLLFQGAAASGEIPALWGSLGPLLAALAVGTLQLKHLRT